MTLSSSQLLPLLTSRQVLPNFLGSDHSLINFSIVGPTPSTTMIATWIDGLFSGVTFVAASSRPSSQPFPHPFPLAPPRSFRCIMMLLTLPSRL